MTEASLKALALLRDPSNFQWHLVTLLAFVFFVYAHEVGKRNWNGICAGFAFFLTDIFWEIVNALILHYSNESALWLVTGGTAYLIFVGLSIEIGLMFAVAGVVFTKFLPGDRNFKILGLPNRWFFIIVNSLFSAAIECLLVQTPYFHWGYRWWSFPLVALVGYMPFNYIAFKVFDSSRKFQILTVVTLLSLDVALIFLFGVMLRWI